MTRCVVYDYETVEPITVIHLKARWVEFLLKHGQLAVPTFPPIESLGALADGEVLGPVPTLRVYVSPFKIHSPSGAFGIGLFVRDPEGALLLKPTTLPGQDSLISDAYREGYGAALIEMLSAVIPGDKA